MSEVSGLFAAGRRLGRYQLIRRLAVGGMAEIYLARSSGREAGFDGFEKLVVLKKILPQHALDPQLLRMFLDEARLMATLSNPHITQVYDVGSEGDAPFFAMEYVHGANLREIMRAADGLIPLPHALGIVAAAAAGLHYAHEKVGPDGQPLRIVHRDVSPSNVLVTYDGSVKVSDFGIAKWAAQRSQTQEGALKGKFAYMSPEQCRGEALDRRSDVFALGTLLYEITTGQPPFKGASDYDILTQIVNGDVPAPAGPDGRYPKELARIVTRALARQPDNRHPTAQALQLDIEAFAREEKLLVSTVALGQYMSTLFADRIERWRAAQQSGKSLEEHLAERLAEAEAEAIAEARTPTPVTATDAFASAARGGAAGAARARPHRRRRAAAIGAALSVVALAGGVTAAARLLRSTATQPPHTVESHLAPPVDDSVQHAQPAPPVAAPAAAAPPRQARPPAEVAAAHADGAASSTGAPVRGKRAARAKTTTAAATTGVATGKAAPGLETWDPDSPIPP
jgi:tRNA A-37 threonylcarbamoyl transferase component Bud32